MKTNDEERMESSVNRRVLVVIVLVLVALACAGLFGVYFKKYSDAEDEISDLKASQTNTRNDGAAGPARPHIILIMADDLGWNDIGYNNPAVKTPNLNKLAEEGRILTQHYTNSVCTPSPVRPPQRALPAQNGDAELPAVAWEPSTVCPRTSRYCRSGSRNWDIELT